jgi:hypothetical protein
MTLVATFPIDAANRKTRHNNIILNDLRRITQLPEASFTDLFPLLDFPLRRPFDSELPFLPTPALACVSSRAKSSLHAAWPESRAVWRRGTTGSPPGGRGRQTPSESNSSSTIRIPTPTWGRTRAHVHSSTCSSDRCQFESVRNPSSPGDWGKLFLHLSAPTSEVSTPQWFPSDSSPSTLDRW